VKRESSTSETNISARLVFGEDIKGDLIWTMTNIRKFQSQKQENLEF
jgi:hypothetical protein